MDNILNKVMTTKEIAKKYPVADSTIRGWIMDGEFNPEDIRKSEGTWLIKKEAIIKLLIDKKLYGKKFEMEDVIIYVEHLIYKDENIEMWLSNDSSKAIFEECEDFNLAIQALINYQKTVDLDIKNVLIDDNLDIADNWLLRDFNVLAITALECKNIIKQVVKNQKCSEQNNFKKVNKLLN